MKSKRKKTPIRLSKEQFAEIDRQSAAASGLRRHLAYSPGIVNAIEGIIDGQLDDVASDVREGNLESAQQSLSVCLFIVNALQEARPSGSQYWPSSPLIEQEA